MRLTTCVRDSDGRAWIVCRSSCTQGGLLITASDTTNFAVTFGFTTGVGMAPGTAPEGYRVRAALEDGGCGEPHRVRLRR